MSLKVLIVYYSTFGNTYKMALEVAKGVKEVPGAEAVIRTVPELIPEEIINAREDIKKGKELQKDVPLVTLDDFREASAIAFGTPTRFGVVSAQLKNQIDRLSPLWQERALEGKPAGIFVSTSTLHGGQEMTIFSLLPALLHLGMIFVGVPYSVKELFTTKGGGSPYGPGHVAGDNSQRELDEEEKAILRAFGKRLTLIAQKLSK
ncbi:MAG: NAD(P)H:quinone oxidoreductase [Caldimicrobium sp.]